MGTNQRRDNSSGAEVVRRALEIIMATGLLLLALPVLLVVIAGSALSLKASPFFAQDRIGRHGRRFRFFKVRTLPPTAPAYTDKHQLDMGALPAFCRLVRRLHLDEIPQLALVMVGRMSLVGPRPEMPYLHDAMAPDFAAQRTSVRPGVTGLWQVSVACAGLIHAAPEYDRFYLEHRTLRLDAWILYRTALKMVGVGRPVELSEIPSWVLRRQPAVESIAASAPASASR